MANPAHLLRRQSSRDLVRQHSKQRSFDNVELRELRNRLANQRFGSHGSLYGALNQGFQGEHYNHEQHQYNTIGAISASSGHHPILSSLFEAPDSSHLLTSEKEVIREEEENIEEEKIEAEIIQAEEERAGWDSKLTFLLATIGYAVGLGNVWRFPYLAQKNGGGAFLVPYFIMLFIQGLPIFYLELAIGQRLRKGAIGVWQQVNPYLAGIGISSAVVSFIVAIYYNTIISWCLLYLFHSIESPLPWAECPKRFYPNNMTYDLEPECVASSPTQYYWYRATLQSSPSVDEPQMFNLPVAVALILAWVLIYMCMVKGITESGKVVYITAIFPYVVLIIFFFRGITLKGASAGLHHLFTPRWERLADPVVWMEAGTQIFFSLGLAFGGLIAFSSYNPANNNCYRDALLVSFTNCGTSMFAGIVVFAVIGFKATATYDGCLAERASLILQNSTKVLPECNLQKELDNSASGTGLAFIIFTEAINQFPGAQFWAVLFFLMLFTLGVDSQFGTLEGVSTSLMDMKLFPKASKEKITGVLCLSCSIISMIFANGAGSYIFSLMDSFAGNYTLLIIAFCECISVSYIYGLKRFADDIELMTGKRPDLYWMICWKFISPAAMIMILLASIFDLAMNGSKYAAWDALTGTTVVKDWPHWCIVIAVLLIGVSILWIPGVAICRLMGIKIVEDSEPAAFPTAELREVHGIVAVQPTSIERSLFCIKDDGTEGFCCPTYHVPEKTLEEEE